MPALPDVPSVLRMHLQFHLGTDLDVLVRSFWQYSGTAPTDAQLATAAASIYTGVSSHTPALQPSTDSFTAVELVDLSSPTAAIGSATGSTPGTRTGNPLAANTAADLAFTIARRYRGGKPHTMLPFGTSSDLTNPQEWDGALTTAIATFWGEVQAELTAAIWSGGGSIAQVNVSYYGPPNRTVTSSTGRVRTISTTRATPIVDPIISYACQTRPGSARRRLGKAA